METIYRNDYFMYEVRKEDNMYYLYANDDFTQPIASSQSLYNIGQKAYNKAYNNYGVYDNCPSVFVAPPELTHEGAWIFFKRKDDDEFRLSGEIRQHFESLLELAFLDLYIANGKVDFVVLDREFIPERFVGINATEIDFDDDDFVRFLNLDEEDLNKVLEYLHEYNHTDATVLDILNSCVYEFKHAPHKYYDYKEVNDCSYPILTKESEFGQFMFEQNENYLEPWMYSYFMFGKYGSELLNSCDYDVTDNFVFRHIK